MELTRQIISYESAPLRASSRAAAEGTLTPPASLPPMAKVLCVDGRATASAEAAEGKLLVDGAVTLSVLYVCPAGKTYGFESTAVFRHNAELPGAQPGMAASVCCAVGELSWRLSGGAIELRAEVLLECEAAGAQSLSAVSALSLPGLEAKTETLCAAQCRTVPEELGLHDEVRLPRTAERLLCVNGFCRIQSAACEEGGKAFLSGMLRLCAVFAAPDGTIVQSPFSLPFEARVPLPEGTEKVFAFARLLMLSGTLVDEDVLSVEARTQVSLCALSQKAVTVYTDAYAADADLTCTLSPLNLCEPAGCLCRGTLRLEAALPEGMPDAERVLCAQLRPALEGCTPGAGTLCASGTMYASILYLCREGNLHSFEAALPFSCDCDCPALSANSLLLCDAACELLHAGAATGSILLQCALDCAVRVSTVTDHCVVTDAALSPLKNSLYGPVVYFPAEGEGLWDVGKRFCVPLEELRALNPALEKELPAALLLNLRRRAASQG